MSDVDSPAVTALSICSGIAGLELGVGLVVPGLRVIAYVERDIPAAKVLAQRMDDGALHPAPIWSDVTTFDGTRWVGAVDFVMGGIPCQPFSVAGKRQGQDDERWIWPDIWRWVRAIRPSLIFLENVPGFVRHGLPVVLGDLAEAGYVAEWDVVRAADVGAPQIRERVFVLAYADDRWEPQLQGGKCDERRWASDGGNALAHADPIRPRTPGAGWLFPPGPGDRAGWIDYIEVGGAEPAIRRGADGIPGRLDRLHQLGNGVVPLVAAVAFSRLAARLGLDIGG
jgi:DNA (cytosine-5)-methyltransferase 1